MTVLEPLRCPGCSTRFVLGAARVRPGHRRAKCFRCGSVFPIEEAVTRLLAPVPEPAALAPEPELAPSLTPNDLQVHDALLDPPVASSEPAEAPHSATGAGYASAKDAIERLMGSAPAPPAPVRLGGRNSMDVEATLDALSSTLGMAPAAPPKSDMSSTVKLTSEEIKVAMAAMGDHAKAVAPALPPRPAPSADIQPPPPAEPVLDQGTDLLKIQLEQETCNNVTVEQMASWIEQGRVLEYHMVARQFSEHWIEASKVPALRPAFDRVRRLREAQPEEAPKPVPEAPPVKRGLFSGLFGRN
jgi:predicted Zn finger-like uncharacterized protein